MTTTAPMKISVSILDMHRMARRLNASAGFVSPAPPAVNAPVPTVSRRKSERQLRE
jgi:hypothetical protein